MKKYIVTERHEFLKKGAVLDYNINDSLVYLFSVTEYINNWVKSGWIEEIQEHEFTKRDLTGFADHCLNTRIKDIDSAFDMWIDIKNEI